jgi:flagellar assembly protein FliH
MMNMSRIVKNSQKPPLALSGEAEAAGRFMPLAEFWRDADPDGGEMNLQQRSEEIKKQQDKMLSQAREEGELIRKQAYQEGHAEGERAGRAEGKAEYDQAIKKLETVLLALQNEINGRNQRYEQEILLLIKTMVDRLVHHEVSVSSAVIQACLREALHHVVQNSRVRIHLHPDDFQRLREASIEDPALLEGKKRLEMVEDQGISVGGCLLETDFGEVDVTRENAREKLYEAVDRAFAGQAPALG